MKKIERLEAELERTNTMHEQEQRLMTTNFYAMVGDGLGNGRLPWLCVCSTPTLARG